MCLRAARRAAIVSISTKVARTSSGDALPLPMSMSARRRSRTATRAVAWSTSSGISWRTLASASADCSPMMRMLAKVARVMTLDEFVAATQRTLADAESYAAEINSLSEATRVKTLSKIPYINEQYVRIVNNRLVVEKNLANMDIVNFKISRHIYATYVNLTDELQRNGYKVTVQTYSKVVEHLAANPTARTTFRELFDEYCRLKTMTEQFFVVESPAELCAVIEQRHPLVKQAYDELGTAKVQALKYHVGNIKRELMKRQPAPTEYKIVKMINTTFQKQTPITKSKVKAELQRIYDDLGIKQRAKAADLNK